ncbi:MAG: nucleotidyltransferase domain-containing protein [Armatimonadetes bacterium]|nr:nucleotidyltransferase domain-containing protein [Armatimonadota bacterium]
MGLETLKQVAKWIKEKFHAEKVILFGSFLSMGEKAQDIDLLVIMKTNLKPYKQTSLIRMAMDKEFGVFSSMDIIVRTPEQVEERLKLGDYFIKSILSEGMAL